jgi:hypothetical protein
MWREGEGKLQHPAKVQVFAGILGSNDDGGERSPGRTARRLEAVTAGNQT